MEMHVECCGESFWFYIVLIVCLVTFSGLMSGLTLGLMSLGLVDLEVLKQSGSEKDRKHAARILPVMKKPHLLLCTLLIGNALAMEALPIFLDALVPSWAAIILSVTLILLFGEIIPQAVCSRYGLAIGASLAPLVKLLVLLFLPIALPISKLLDLMLGANNEPLYRRAELKAFVNMHGKMEGRGGDLTVDETTIINGALELAGKTVGDAMTPIEHAFSLNIDTKLDLETMQQLMKRGHSRVPIYHGSPNNIIGLLLVKNLLTIRSEDATPIHKVPIRRIPRVRASLPLYDMLNEFQRGHSHMAVVTAPARASTTTATTTTTTSTTEASAQAADLSVSSHVNFNLTLSLSPTSTDALDTPDTPDFSPFASPPSAFILPRLHTRTGTLSAASSSSAAAADVTASTSAASGNPVAPAASAAPSTAAAAAAGLGAGCASPNLHAVALKKACGAAGGAAGGASGGRAGHEEPVRRQSLVPLLSVDVTPWDVESEAGTPTAITAAATGTTAAAAAAARPTVRSQQVTTGSVPTSGAIVSGQPGDGRRLALGVHPLKASSSLQNLTAAGGRKGLFRNSVAADLAVDVAELEAAANRGRKWRRRKDAEEGNNAESAGVGAGTGFGMGLGLHVDGMMEAEAVTAEHGEERSLMRDSEGSSKEDEEGLGGEASDEGETEAGDGQEEIVVGIITMEDVIEELLQEEILDETDVNLLMHRCVKVPSSAELTSSEPVTARNSGHVSGSVLERASGQARDWVSDASHNRASAAVASNRTTSST